MMTVNTFDPNASVITLTDSAIKHFKKALEGKEETMVRLSTETNGCSGYGYVLDLVSAPEAEDSIVDTGELTFAVANDALEILKGTEIDMVTEGVNRVVKFNNPNVVAECGCGESFSIGWMAYILP